MQGTETKTLLAIALVIDKASATDVQSDSPGHAALGLALVRAVIFGTLLGFFLLWNVQFWYNWWKKLLRIIVCRRYLKIAVSSAKCFCFTTK